MKYSSVVLVMVLSLAHKAVAAAAPGPAPAANVLDTDTDPLEARTPLEPIVDMNDPNMNFCHILGGRCRRQCRQDEKRKLIRPDPQCPNRQDLCCEKK